MNGKMYAKIFSALMLLACISACNPATNSSQEASPQADSLAADTESTSLESADELPPIVPKIDFPFEMLGNMEMVPFCLPYPKDEFSENFDLSEGKGHHVLVSKDKKSKLVFAGAILEMKTSEILDKCIQDVTKLTGAAPETIQQWDNGFHLRWKSNGKLTSMRKWCREAEKESVTATFEYPEADAAKFRNWVFVIFGQTSICE
jgi:hypothetical protein